MKIIGEKSRFGFEIGPNCNESKQLQHVTIWSAGKSLNPVDDVVYLPTFYTRLQAEINRIEVSDFDRPDFRGLRFEEIYRRFDDEEDENHQILSYDVSTCAARCFFIERNNRSTLLWSYWDKRHNPPDEIGTVFTLDISKKEILVVLKESLRNLSNVWV